MANQNPAEHHKPKQVRMVYPRSEQEWVNECLAPEGDMSIHDSRDEAVAYAVAMVENAGGGEITVRGLTGEVEDRKTIRPNGASSHVSIGRGPEEVNSFSVDHAVDMADESSAPAKAEEERLSVKGRKKSRKKASPPDQG